MLPLGRLGKGTRDILCYFCNSVRVIASKHFEFLELKTLDDGNLQASLLPLGLMKLTARDTHFHCTEQLEISVQGIVVSF